MLHEVDFDAPALAAPDREAEAADLLAQAIRHDFAGRIALVSSLGAESVVLLHLVARINPATPVLFNETGMLFEETLDYQRKVAARLGLTALQIVRPTRWHLSARDAGGQLYGAEADACCTLRKREPLMRALAPFSAWITGRKRFQNRNRSVLPLREMDEAGRVKLNPLARWRPDDIQGYIARHDLPRHPLVAQGFPSIGCRPCTTRVAPGEDMRAGRWRGSEKTECGIHWMLRDDRTQRRA